MKAYFYCRVAHDDSFSLERQAEELRRYAEQAGYTIVGAAAEHGSGMTLDRPALQEVMEAVLAGKVDVVLISSLDRLGRDWGMTKQYIDLLTEHKVKLLCVRERMMIDSSSFSPFFTYKSRVSITGYSDPIRTLCMVGVSGFEPEASWTRTKRDTKLRHTPLTLVL